MYKTKIYKCIKQSRQRKLKNFKAQLYRKKKMLHIDGKLKCTVENYSNYDNIICIC